MDTIKFPFYARVALILLSVVLLYIILVAASGILIPLFFALLIAILLLPINKLFERKLRLGRALSAFLSVTLFLSAIGGLLYFLALQLVVFSTDFPSLQTRFMDVSGNVQHWLSHRLHITTRQQTDYVNKSTMRLVETAGNSISNFLLSVSGILLSLIIIFIFTFFILYYRRLLMRFLQNLFSEYHRSKVAEVVLETKGMINAYVSGLLIEIVIIGIVNCTMLLLMGVRYALLLGTLVAVLNVIPYLGFYSATVVCVLVTFVNSSGAAALQVGVGLLIVHLLDANILFPRIIGGRVKMNPFITILAVIVGQHIWGVPGMFLFIPLVGGSKLVCERVEGLKAWGILIGSDD